MKVFVSWSGVRSQAVAIALRDWLRQALHPVETWMSEEDIAKGKNWDLAITTAFRESRFSIVCLTPENLESRWLHFEAGAIANQVGDAYVCPYLLELSPTDVSYPLAGFQPARANEADTLRLAKSINAAMAQLGEPSRSESDLEASFRAWWPHLRTKLDQLPAPAEATQVRPGNRDLLPEMLELLRSNDLRLGRLEESLLTPDSHGPWAGPTDSRTADSVLALARNDDERRAAEEILEAANLRPHTVRELVKLAGRRHVRPNQTNSRSAALNAIIVDRLARGPVSALDVVVAALEAGIATDLRDEVL